MTAAEPDEAILDGDVANDGGVDDGDDGSLPAPGFPTSPFPIPESPSPASSAEAAVPDQAADSPFAEFSAGPLPPSPSLEEFIETEPHWRDAIVDDHALLWRQVREGFEFLPRGDFGLTTIGFESTIHSDVLPGVWVTPKFGWRFLDGPGTPDLPPQLYDLAIDINLAKPIDDGWTVHLMLSPTLSTDFDNKRGDALRIIGGGMLAWRYDDEFEFVLGGMALDRPDLPFLPIGGVQWSPGDNLRIDLVVPRPRIAVLLSEEDATQHWLYLAGELGGGSWAYERDSGLKDRVGYRDLRAVIGLETHKSEGARHILEAGYVFDRRLDFHRGPGDRRLDPTAVIRWGMLY